jgi:hypothetical protein
MSSSIEYHVENFSQETPLGNQACEDEECHQIIEEEESSIHEEKGLINCTSSHNYELKVTILMILKRISSHILLQP